MIQAAKNIETEIATPVVQKKVILLKSGVEMYYNTILLNNVVYIIENSHIPEYTNVLVNHATDSATHAGAKILGSTANLLTFSLKYLAMLPPLLF